MSEQVEYELYGEKVLLPKAVGDYIEALRAQVNQLIDGHGELEHERDYWHEKFDAALARAKRPQGAGHELLSELAGRDYMILADDLERVCNRYRASLDQAAEEEDG